MFKKVFEKLNFFLNIIYNFTVSNIFYLIKKPLLILIWFFFLPVVFLIVNIQIFFIFFWFFIYIIYIIYIFYKFKIQHINDLYINYKPVFYDNYKNSKYNNNFVILFNELILNIPKKYAFNYFYIFIKFFLKEEFKFFFKNNNINLKNFFFKLISFILIIFFYTLIKILTYISILIFKTNNKVSTRFYNLTKFKRENFKALYTNFILDILTSFNVILNMNIKFKKIKFKNNEIIFNPFKIKSTTLTPINISYLKSAINNVTIHSELKIFRQGTSKSSHGITIYGENKNIHLAKINFEKNENFINNDYPPTLNEYKSFEKKPKSDHIDKWNYYTYSGYTNKDWSYIEKNVKSETHNKLTINELKSNQLNLENSKLFKPYLASDEDTVIINCSDQVSNNEISIKAKHEFAKELIKNYYKNIYIYKFENREIFLEKSSETIEETLKNPKNNLSTWVKNMIEELDLFFEKNPHLKEDVNQDHLNNIVEKYVGEYNELVN